MKRKVLILVNHEVTIYNLRKELVERLLSEGYEVIISSPHGKKIDELIEMGCVYEEIEIERHGTNIFKELKLLMSYFKLIKKIKPDVVLTYTIKPNIYGSFASMLCKVPYIANITGLGSAVEQAGLLQKITVFLYRISFKNIKTIFFQNEENKSFFVKYNLYNDRHQLLPGSGVNLNRFTLLEYPDSDIIKFVFISRIMKEKGIDQYLEAARYIKSKYPLTEFHVCGFYEDDYEGIIAKAQEEGTIIYHGMLDDVREILSITHCTVHPTYYPEGLSNVLLESAASGRPIITTDRAGCREVIDDGINGYLVRERDSKDLIDKIEKFLVISYEDKRDMGLAGRTKVENEFDRQIVVSAYIKEIKEI